MLVYPLWFNISNLFSNHTFFYPYNILYNKVSCFDISKPHGLPSHGHCGSQHACGGTAIAPAPTSCTSPAYLKGDRLAVVDCNTRACGRGVLWALPVCRNPLWCSGSSSWSQHWVCLVCVAMSYCIESELQHEACPLPTDAISSNRWVFYIPWYGKSPCKARKTNCLLFFNTSLCFVWCFSIH